MSIEDDPDRLTTTISDEWLVGGKLQIDRECENGMFAPMDYMEVETGDFVDVMITPDIVSRNDGTTVGFSMVRMVVLFKKPVVEVRIHNINGTCNLTLASDGEQ